MPDESESDEEETRSNYDEDSKWCPSKGKMKVVDQVPMFDREDFPIKYKKTIPQVSSTKIRPCSQWTCSKSIMPN